MANFHSCLVCNNPSQTDIDGKGNGKRKLKGIDVVKSQIRSVFLLEKLLEVSNSTCVNLLKINEGANPSSWFSCCWSCFAIIEEAENVFNELIKLEKQWKNVKVAIQTKLQTSRDKKLQQSKVTLGEKINEITINTIRNEAFKCTKGNDLLDEFKFSPAQENLNEIKIEVNEEIITGDVPYRTRSGRLIRHAKSSYESASVSSIEEQNDWSDNYLSGLFGQDSESDNQYSIEEESLTKNKTEKTGSNFTPNKSLNKNERTHDVLHSEKQVKCKHCGVEFINAKVRRLHEISTHESLYKLQCNHCFKKYATEESLHLHIRGCHNGKINPDPACILMVKSTEIISGNRNEDVDIIRSSFEGDNDCDKKNTPTIIHRKPKTSPPSKRRKMNRNETKHSKKVKTFKCEHCLEEYPSRKKRLGHEMIAHESLFHLDCKHCNKTYLKLEYRNNHLRKYHEGKVNPDPACTLRLNIPVAPHDNIEKKTMCDECNHEYKTVAGLQIHKAAVHRKEKNFICEVCSMAFASSSQLKNHQTCKHGDSETQKSLQCKECGKILANPIALKGHIKIVHKKDYPFRCSICNTGALFQSYLDRHMLLTHTDGPKPHACDICEKSYVTKHYLDIHKRTHTGERPFKCSFCEKCFHSKTKMVRHERGSHVQEKNFQCEQCDSRFPSKHYLSMHTYSTHNKKKGSLPRTPKKIVDKQELIKYVESANKALQEKPLILQGKKDRVGVTRLYMEQQLKQKGLLRNDTTENSTEKQPCSSTSPNLSNEELQQNEWNHQEMFMVK